MPCALAATVYVTPTGTGNGSSWANALGSIQQAVIAANPGDTVVVTNGTYYETIISSNKTITIRSQNGYAATIIDAGHTGRVATLAHDEGQTNTILIGFTLQNGSSDVGAGVYGGTVIDSLLMGNEASIMGGGAAFSSLYGTQIKFNTASNAPGLGGAVYKGYLNDCTLQYNSARLGGGAANSVLTNCVVTSNDAVADGGGAYQSSLNDAALGANTANRGGGAYESGLTNCLVDSNTAADQGAGVWGGTIVNSTLRNNGTTNIGGAAVYAILIDCYIVNNSADVGGGVEGSTLTGCVVSNNSANTAGGARGSTLNYCTVLNNMATLAGGGTYGCTNNYSVIRGNHATGSGSYGGGGVNSLFNFCTISENTAYTRGGGVAYSELNNCIVSENSVTQNDGGGAVSSILNNCLVTENEAPSGAGAHSSTLVNCTVSRNIAGNYGGGTHSSHLKNCIAWGNSAGTSGLNIYLGAGSVSNTLSDSIFGDETNFDEDPEFVDPENGNYRLQTNSVAINNGNNDYVVGTKDVLGKARIVGGYVDLGAYEFTGGTSSEIPLEWLEEHNLPTDGSADGMDPDHDGFTNYDEWVAGTNPTNAQSYLRAKIEISGGSPAIHWSPDLSLAFPSRSYSIYGTANLLDGFSGIPLTNLPGGSSPVAIESLTPQNRFRVGVELAE